jgi:hypothetical protein
MTRTIEGLLRTALLAGSVCAFPALARAGGGAEKESVDLSHANVESRGGAADAPESDRQVGRPDHNQAEARGPAGTVVPVAERAGRTDHGAVERRGTDAK